MGQLLQGKWVEDSYAKKIMSENENIKNSDITGVIKKDIEEDNIDKMIFKAEKDRYHLYLAYGCPWATRVAMMWSLKGLENVISVSFVNPYLGEDGWSFTEDEGVDKDPIINAKYLRDIYTLSDNNYTGRVSVPVLFDKKTKTIVNNMSSDIMKILNREFDNILEENKSKKDFRPEKILKEMSALDDKIENNICRGVYSVGNAPTQEMYDKAVEKLFSTFDELDTILGDRVYLAGDMLTEMDIKLFPFLVRFDTVYNSLYKCSKKRVVDYKNLWRYTKELYNIKEITKTINMEHIKKTYYGNKKINPTGIIPIGPEINW